MLRFAPSPTGDMHIGNLRVAIFNFIIAKQRGEKFLIRIEDTDCARNIKGADKEILEILNLFGLFWDKLVYQSDNFPLHRKLAQNLIEKNKAFYCYATKEFLEQKRAEASAQKRAFRYDDLWAEECKEENKKPVIRLRGNLSWGMQFRTCENFWDSADHQSSVYPKNSHKYKSHTAITSIVDSASQNLGENPRISHEVRKSFCYFWLLPKVESSLPYRLQATKQRKGAESTLDSTPFIAFTDAIKGECKFRLSEIDSFVIMRENIPTYNFACAVDDMLYDISFIIRGEDHTSNTPKQMLIHRALGYDKGIKYAHLPIILNDKGSKMSKRESESSVKWLLSQGFLPRAIVNYLLLMGNNPPCEIFTLDEAIEWFDLSQLSKSPVRFDMGLLRHINREHLKRLSDGEMELLLASASEMLSNISQNLGAESVAKSAESAESHLAKSTESHLAESAESHSAESHKNYALGAIGRIFLEEANTLNELCYKVCRIFAPKDLDNFEFGENARILKNEILYLLNNPTQSAESTDSAESIAKSHADSADSADSTDSTDSAKSPLDDFESLKSALSKKVAFKGKAFFAPLRFLLTGAQKGPHLDALYPHLRIFLHKILKD